MVLFDNITAYSEIKYKTSINNTMKNKKNNLKGLITQNRRIS